MDVCCFQTRSSRPPLRTIRVVHLDGLVEDYKYPTTIDEVITIFPKHFLTTPIRLLQIGLIPLKPDTQLEPGRIYFLLPYAILRFNDSSDNLICLTRKLTKIAKTRQIKTKPAPWANPQDKAKTPSTSPQDNGSSQISNDGSNGEKNDMRRSTKGRFSWKPLLSTIREISFNRRESDVSFNRRDSIRSTHLDHKQLKHKGIPTSASLNTTSIKGERQEHEKEQEHVIVEEGDDVNEGLISRLPPKNVFLLTRCRSAPYRSSSLANKLLESTVEEP